MDTQKLHDAYQRLQSLDDRLTHKIRPRAGGSMVRPSADQLEIAVREVAAYTIELKEILQALFESLGASPSRDQASSS
jgi:hypothetical protein